MDKKSDCYVEIPKIIHKLQLIIKIFDKITHGQSNVYKIKNKDLMNVMTVFRIDPEKHKNETLDKLL